MRLARIERERPDLVSVLRGCAAFQRLPEHLLRSIAAIARPVTFAARSVIYRVGDPADDLFVVVSGKVDHALGPDSSDKRLSKVVSPGELIGWAAVLKGRPTRLADAVCAEKCELIRINGERLLKLLESDPEAGQSLLGYLAKDMVADFAIPPWVTQLGQLMTRPTRMQAAWNRFGQPLRRVASWLKSPRPYLMLTGFVLLLGFWYLSVEVWHLPRFRQMPGLTAVVREWTSRAPTFGLSLYTEEYYQHIAMSIWRVAKAFFLATLLGVPLGLVMGWSRRLKDYVFPVFELLRPIPALAWVPMAIVMFTSSESAVTFLTFLAAFFATALNTMLGVVSIDESYVRAAYCLGARRAQVFRHVIIPGALPFIFTGLQISVGVSWFSLVAAEMVSGQYGLGFVINTSYTMVRYPTIVIGMVTLGLVGYATSALVRLIGDRLMQWRTRELALEQA